MSELTGLPLFDARGLVPTLGEVLKQKGIKQVSENEKNLDRMVDCIFDTASRFPSFTADEVMDAMEKAGIVPHHPNAIGAAFSKAAKEKLIESTNQYQKSTRSSNHSRMVRIWHSAWRSK